MKFDPLRAKEKTIRKFLDRTGIMKKLRLMNMGENEGFTEIGYLLKGEPKLKEIRKILQEFKTKKFSPEQKAAFLGFKEEPEEKKGKGGWGSGRRKKPGPKGSAGPKQPMISNYTWKSPHTAKPKPVVIPPNTGK